MVIYELSNFDMRLVILVIVINPDIRLHRLDFWVSIWYDTDAKMMENIILSENMCEEGLNNQSGQGFS